MWKLTSEHVGEEKITHFYKATDCLKIHSQKGPNLMYLNNLLQLSICIHGIA